MLRVSSICFDINTATVLVIIEITSCDSLNPITKGIFSTEEPKYGRDPKAGQETQTVDYVQTVNTKKT